MRKNITLEEFNRLVDKHNMEKGRISRLSEYCGSDEAPLGASNKEWNKIGNKTSQNNCEKCLERWKEIYHTLAEEIQVLKKRLDKCEKKKKGKKKQWTRPI